MFIPCKLGTMSTYSRVCICITCYVWAVCCHLMTFIVAFVHYYITSIPHIFGYCYILSIHAGKKLVGKPFITDSNQIFCGDQVLIESRILIPIILYHVQFPQCKQTFEQNPCTVTILNDSQVSKVNIHMHVQIVSIN